MKYSDNAINILAASTFEGKSYVWINKNLKDCKSFNMLCNLLDTNEYELNKKRDAIRNEIEKLRDSIDGVIALGDPGFPEFRGNVKEADKPFALFYKGNIDLLEKSNNNIAIIGLLNPDEKIKMAEKTVTLEIIKLGATVVSGLALGCDTIAHQTAIEYNGKTIAILPCALNEIIPKENTELAKQIVSNKGLLISEYYNSPKNKYDIVNRFIKRDRLQALFSDTVILSASYAENNIGNDSGSRHAMNKAKEYGIKRAVIYNDIKHANNPMYDLNRKYLNEDRTVIKIDSGNMIKAVNSLLSPNRLSTASFFP